jgi:hypothetical protein
MSLVLRVSATRHTLLSPTRRGDGLDKGIALGRLSERKKLLKAGG